MYWCFQFLFLFVCEEVYPVPFKNRYIICTSYHKMRIVLIVFKFWRIFCSIFIKNLLNFVKIGISISNLKVEPFSKLWLLGILWTPNLKSDWSFTLPKFINSRKLPCSLVIMHFKFLFIFFFRLIWTDWMLSISELSNFIDIKLIIFKIIKTCWIFFSVI